MPLKRAKKIGQGRPDRKEKEVQLGYLGFATPVLTSCEPLRVYRGVFVNK